MRTPTVDNKEMLQGAHNMFIMLFTLKADVTLYGLRYDCFQKRIVCHFVSRVIRAEANADCFLSSVLSS